MSCTRSQMVKQMQSWVGLKESDGSHKKIIDIYNTLDPIPVGYKLKYTDAWCAGTVSAAAQVCDATDITPTECSVPRMVDKAKEMGIWVEADNYVPLPGDHLCYDWGDNGKGDNTGRPDHVGTVEKCDGHKITIIEGNYENAVKRRELEVNGKYIRGYIVPHYDAESDQEQPEPLIYINPGHSDKDPGAVSYETERKLNVKVSDYMNQHLLENYVCRTKVTDGSINSTTIVCQEANACNAALLVSNHFNAGKGDGWEGLIHNSGRMDLGKIFEKHVMAAGQNSRGVKLRPNLNVLKSTNMAAILNEGAFVDNKKDIEDWNEDAELQKLGIAYAEAAAEYLGLKEKTVEPELVPDPVAPQVPQTVLMELPVLARGSEGKAVMVLQTLLNASGYPCGDVDGDFGRNTEKAVKCVSASGIADATVWQKLLQE